MNCDIVSVFDDRVSLIWHRRTHNLVMIDLQIYLQAGGNQNEQQENSEGERLFHANQVNIAKRCRINYRILGAKHSKKTSDLFSWLSIKPVVGR